MLENDLKASISVGFRLGVVEWKEGSVGRNGR